MCRTLYQVLHTTAPRGMLSTSLSWAVLHPVRPSGGRDAEIKSSAPCQPVSELGQRSPEPRELGRGDESDLMPMKAERPPIRPIKLDTARLSGCAAVPACPLAVGPAFGLHLGRDSE